VKRKTLQIDEKAMEYEYDFVLGEYIKFVNGGRMINLPTTQV